MSIRGDEPLSAGGGPGPDGGRGRADEAGAADAVAGPSVSGSAGAAVSSGGALGGGAVGDPPDGDLGRGTASSPTGPDDGPRADGPSVGGRLADDPVGELSADSPADGLPDDGPVDDLPVDDPVDDLPDDLPAVDGGGVSPVVREYVEGLRREALARDAELRARGIDPYKGTPVGEEPRQRLGARTLAVLAVLVVAVVSVGAYVVFFRGGPDYGMSHGYQVQSDGSLKRPPVTDKAPVQPAEMSKGDEAGAAAAARYYLNAYSYAWNTGDTAPIKAISDEECAFCRREIAQIDEFYSNGYWAKGTYASITNTDSIDRVSDDATDAAIYDVQFHIDEHTPEGYSSKGYESGSRYDTIIKFRVQWKENEWRVVDGRAADADAVS